MPKLPRDPNVPPSARSLHPSFQSRESDEPAIDPDPDVELDGEVIDLVLRELDGADESGGSDSGSPVSNLHLLSDDQGEPEIYDYEGDASAPSQHNAPSQHSASARLSAPVAAGAGPEDFIDDDLDAWPEPDDNWFNYAPGDRSSGSIASIDSAGSIAATKSAGSIASANSAGSIASANSAGSIASANSAGSIASALSAGSIASLLSIGSLGSIFSIGSYRSILSIGSRNSVLSIGAEDGFLTIGRGPNAKSFGGA